MSGLRVNTLLNALQIASAEAAWAGMSAEIANLLRPSGWFSHMEGVERSMRTNTRRLRQAHTFRRGIEAEFDKADLELREALKAIRSYNDQ